MVTSVLDEIELDVRRLNAHVVGLQSCGLKCWVALELMIVIMLAKIFKLVV